MHAVSWITKMDRGLLWWVLTLAASCYALENDVLHHLLRAMFGVRLQRFECAYIGPTLLQVPLKQYTMNATLEPAVPQERLQIHRWVCPMQT